MRYRQVARERIWHDRPVASGRPRTGRSGFTLVEVLVVLAVMVILFGLLFAPMISGLNLVSRGRRHVVMQDAVRLALEQMKRDLAEAVYVFDPVVYTVSSIDGQPANSKVVDYNTLVFVPAARHQGTSAPLLPLRPEIGQVYLADYGQTVPAIRAVRYAIHLVKRHQRHAPDNPFALFRQEGYVVRQNGAWKWAEGQEQVENALTPRADVDLPPTLSVCEGCHSAWTGYVEECPNCPPVQPLHYITDAVQFVSQRVCGELLQQSSDGAVYRASMGGWLGTQNDGTRRFGLDLAMLGAEIDPRIVVYRRLQGALQVYADTYDGTLMDPDLSLKWDSAAGVVNFAEPQTVNILFDLGRQPGAYYFLRIDADEYDGSGALRRPPRTARAYPVYADSGAQAWAPAVRAPVAYVVDPTENGARGPAKIIDHSIGARLRLTYSSGASSLDYYYDFERTYTYDQEKIGPWQFCPILSTDGTSAQVRFNRHNPPSPDWFVGSALPGYSLSGFVVELRYAIRRNFDANTGEDDIVRADYSTKWVVNLALTLASYVDLEATGGTPAVLRLPQGVKVHRVEGRDRVVIHNAL
ncbi:MAG: prepilin-type N-terminal cleavage/methylation domain-containing protein [Armatimonadetes bacterium]|nr:prepilin-type N-terminal cleavage/methylation domain-containing protein [Armatimonadota bacterium]